MSRLPYAFSVVKELLGAKSSWPVLNIEGKYIISNVSSQGKSVAGRYDPKGGWALRRFFACSPSNAQQLANEFSLPLNR